MEHQAIVLGDAPEAEESGKGWRRGVGEEVGGGKVAFEVVEIRKGATGVSNGALEGLQQRPVGRQQEFGRRQGKED